MNLHPYWSALALFVVATALSQTARWVWGHGLTDLAYYPAVLLSAWNGGFWPGMLVSVLSAAAIAYEVQPKYSFAGKDLEGIATIGLFLVIGALASHLGERRLSAVTALVVKLRQSEQRYRLLLECNPTGVFLINSTGRLLDCNPAFLQLLGCQSKDEVLGANIERFVDDTLQLEALRADSRPGETIRNRELSWRRPDGSRLTILLNLQRVESDVVQGVVVELPDRRPAQ